MVVRSRGKSASAPSNLIRLLLQHRREDRAEDGEGDEEVVVRDHQAHAKRNRERAAAGGF